MERFINIFPVYNKDKIVLIDSGVKNSTSIISNYLEKTGRKLEEIKLFILTHSNPDHIGDATNIKKASGCKILVHKNERE